MEREITSLYYYIFIRRLSNLLCHIQETIYLCCSSFWSYTDRHTHTKRQEDRPSLSSSILLFFQSTHLKDPSKTLYFFVSICFWSPWQYLVPFPPHFTCASPWPQEQSSIYPLTCAPLSYSRVCALSLPYLFPLQPFPGKKKLWSNCCYLQGFPVLPLSFALWPEETADSISQWSLEKMLRASPISCLPNCICETVSSPRHKTKAYFL